MGAEQQQPDLSTWDDFRGDWIKAEFITKWPAFFVCTGINADLEDGRKKLVALIEYNERSWKFDLNRTNQNFLMSKLENPKALIGLKIQVNKIKARNPAKNSMVDSIIIEEIE